MNRYSFGFWIFVLCAVSASGVFFSWVFYGQPSPLGAVFALFTCVPIIALERGALFPRMYSRLAALSTPYYILATLLVTYVLMYLGSAACRLLLWSLGYLTYESWSEVAVLPPSALFSALGVSAILSFVARVRELLGRDIFSSLLIGRYRKPIEEERVFLFIDLAGSTSFAEEFGDLRAQQLLSALFTTFAQPVRRRNGTIDDYVGDAAIITWPMARGIKNANCVHCVFDILDAIEANSEKWIRKFGQVPRLRAALHGGTIITAEIGVDHHKITYFGDTVNTTARLESLCRTLDAPVLISSDLAKHMDFTGILRAEYLGMHAVRGRGQSLGVMALSRGKPALKLVAKRA
ncbi:adenylate/guanylate cyclase domain-containing protein [Phyllobacterium sp. LjRoot231]|uniref:adenylate/guanylate cyclase domain-containing protein n=1 Tax=Phyllobacterium sp. LjRoot231 TaxID=3342289 RepID=UPI003ED0F6C7